MTDQKSKTQYPHDNKVACKNISLTYKIQLNKLADKESKQSQCKIQIKSNKYPYDKKKKWKNKNISLKNIQHSHKFHFKKHISKQFFFQKSRQQKENREPITSL